MCAQLCTNLPNMSICLCTFVHKFVCAPLFTRLHHITSACSHFCTVVQVIARVMRGSVVHSCAHIRALLCTRMGDVVEVRALFCTLVFPPGPGSQPLHKGCGVGTSRRRWSQSGGALPSVSQRHSSTYVHITLHKTAPPAQMFVHKCSQLSAQLCTKFPHLPQC